MLNTIMPRYSEALAHSRNPARCFGVPQHDNSLRISSTMNSAPTKSGENMIRTIRFLLPILLLAGVSWASVPPETTRTIYEQVTPSVFAVQYVWGTEVSRHELIGAAVVV